MCSLYVMIGPSGAGKSTVAKNLAVKFNAEVVSTDEIRQMLFGDEAIQREGKRVFETAYMTTRAHLNHRRNVIFDATNTTMKGREELLKAVADCPECKQRIAVLVTPFKEISLERNAKRSRKVSEKVIERQYHQLLEDGEYIHDQFDQVIFAG